MSRLQVFSSAENLAQAAAARVTALASVAIAERSRFVVALSGGSTPRCTYRRLARRDALSRVAWSQFEVFWGDERCVPPDHPESNYRMAREALLDHVSVPDSQVHRIHGELPPSQAAAAYEAALEHVLGPRGCFDLVLLGLGSDGHTASLFPESSAIRERERSVVAVRVRKLDTWRITLTLPVINAARHVMFLVSGSEKAEVLAQLRASQGLPAALVNPSSGELTWMVDRKAAAGMLDERFRA